MSVAYTVLRLAAKHQWPATRWLQLSVAGRRVATTIDGYNCRWLQPLRDCMSTDTHHEDSYSLCQVLSEQHSNVTF